MGTTGASNSRIGIRNKDGTSPLYGVGTGVGVAVAGSISCGVGDGGFSVDVAVGKDGAGTNRVLWGAIPGLSKGRSAISPESGKLPSALSSSRELRRGAVGIAFV
jgi:hypothetical protein